MAAYFAHETAHIAENAKIGKDTKIWINVQIREDVKIGEGCIISKDAYIDHAVQIGDRVKIQNGVSVYHGVTIEDEVFVGPNAAFTNDYYPRAQNPEWEVTPTLICGGSFARCELYGRLRPYSGEICYGRRGKRCHARCAALYARGGKPGKSDWESMPLRTTSTGRRRMPKMRFCNS